VSIEVVDRIAAEPSGKRFIVKSYRPPPEPGPGRVAI
jgi:hypothetical protein